VKKKVDKYRQELSEMATVVDEDLSEACVNIDKVEKTLKEQSEEVHR